MLSRYISTEFGCKVLVVTGLSSDYNAEFVTGPSLPVSVEVFDGSNNKVADLTSQVTQKANKVNMTHLGKGTYYLKAIFRGGFIETKRVVID